LLFRLLKAVERGLRPNKHLTRVDGRGGPDLFPEFPHGRDLPFRPRPDHGDLSFLTRCNDLAVGRHRRGEIRVHRAFDASLLQHLAILRIEGSQNAALTQHIQHIAIKQRRWYVWQSLVVTPENVRGGHIAASAQPNGVEAVFRRSPRQQVAPVCLVQCAVRIQVVQEPELDERLIRILVLPDYAVLDLSY
jgi:hypothetical protein